MDFHVMLVVILILHIIDGVIIFFEIFLLGEIFIVCHCATLDRNIKLIKKY